MRMRAGDGVPANKIRCVCAVNSAFLFAIIFTHQCFHVCQHPHTSMFLVCQVLRALRLVSLPCPGSRLAMARRSYDSSSWFGGWGSSWSGSWGGGWGSRWSGSWSGGWGASDGQEWTEAGDGVPARKRSRAIVDRNDMPVGQFVYTVWPMMVWDYPAKNEPNSFGKIKEAVVAAGCTLSLKGKFTEKVWWRKPTLTIKGHRAWEMFHYVFSVTEDLGCDMSRVPLAIAKMPQNIQGQHGGGDGSDSDADSMDAWSETDAIRRHDHGHDEVKPELLTETRYRPSDDDDDEDDFQADYGGGNRTPSPTEEAGDGVPASSAAAAPATRPAASSGAAGASQMAGDGVGASAAAAPPAAPPAAAEASPMAGDGVPASAAAAPPADPGAAALASTSDGDYQWLTDESIAKVPAKYREQIDELDRRINEESDALPSSRVIAFCTTCMRRGWQLKETLTWNLLNAMPYGESCKFFIVVFNKEDPDTVDLLEWLKQYEPLMTKGLLHVAVAEMEYWDCPQAKNIAHRFGIEVCRRLQYQKIFVVNLDADNGFSPSFVPSVMMYAKENHWNTFYSWRGDDGGVTGRMGCWAKRFEELGGYDEDLHGHGHQDVDLRSRFKAAPGGAVVNALDATWRRFSAGWSVCNDENGDLKKAYNEAKMKNTHPKFKNNLSWGQLDGRNKNIAHQKKGQIRNEGRVIGLPYKVMLAGDGVPATANDRALAVVLRPKGEMPALTWGAWREGELPIAVYASKLKGFRAATSGTIKMVTMGLNAGELVFGKKILRHAIGGEMQPTFIDMRREHDICGAARCQMQRT